MAQETNAAERDSRKSFEGIVVSDKMDKTRIVRVERSIRHRFYEKIGGQIIAEGFDDDIPDVAYGWLLTKLMTLDSDAHSVRASEAVQ